MKNHTDKDKLYTRPALEREDFIPPKLFDMSSYYFRLIEERVQC